MAERFVDLGFARVDTDRPRRCGFPEVVYGDGKTPQEVAVIGRTIVSHEGVLLVTRVQEAHYLAVAAEFPDAIWHSRARCVTVERRPLPKKAGTIGVVCAGTSDLPVADNNVRRAMASAVDRLTEKGLVLGGAAECLSPLEALRLYTVNAAKATGLFADRGSLARGKLADFVVLSESPLLARNIADLQVMGTFVGGRQSHARADNDALATA